MPNKEDAKPVAAKKRSARKSTRPAATADEKKAVLAGIDVDAMPSAAGPVPMDEATHIMRPDTPVKGTCLGTISRFSPFAGQYTIEMMESSGNLHDYGIVVNQDTGEQYSVPNATILAKYKSTLGQTVGRLDHALKRLKEKKLYARNLSEMIRICLSKEMNDAVEMIQLLYTHAETLITVADRDTGVEFTDRDYMAAIDMCMLLNHHDAFTSDQKYGGFLERDVAKIYYCVLANHYITAMNSTLTRQDEQIQRIKDETERFGGLGQVLKDVQADLAKGGASTQAAIEKLSRQFSERETKLSVVAEDARRAADAAEAANAPLRKKLADAEADIAKLEGMLADARAKGKAAETKARKLANETDALRTKLERYTLPKLPANGVVFVGGAPNTVKKLSAIYPGWTFIDDDASDAFDVPSAGLIFCYTAHISHKRSNRLEEIARRTGTPFANLPDIVNIEKLDLAMRREYEQLLVKSRSSK